MNVVPRPGKPGSSPAGSRQHGFALLESLIAVGIAGFAMLAVAMLQFRAVQTAGDSLQRAQALVLLQDMASRIDANRLAAAAYVGTDFGLGEPQRCAGLATRAERDLCDWSNLLRGSASVGPLGRTGAMAGARGCISQLAPRTYLIEVAWRGATPTAAPTSPCGRGAYGADDTSRRAVTLVARIADLNAP